MSEDADFTLIVMGCSGGPYETNLSGYLLSAFGSEDFITLDAGTLLTGIEIAYKKKCFENLDLEDPLLSPVGKFFYQRLKAYLISHAHLDHVCGLVINSQADIQKPILGLNPTIDNIRDCLFNGKIWPNCGNEGKNSLNRFEYIRLEPQERTHIPGTELYVRAFILSHPNDYCSSAFLIEWNEKYLLYFGDTSSDSAEKKKRLETVWEYISPLLKNKTLKGMLLECSYSKKHSSKVAYGHLDPDSMIKELSHLAEISKCSLEGFPVIVTHRKDSLLKNENQKQLIEKELTSQNHLGIRWIFPSQGDKVIF